MDLDTISNRQELIGTFPSLADDPNFRISSPSTWDYNCIAWAMGFENRWVSHISDPYLNDIRKRFIWWPPGIEISERCDALIEAFKAVGFEETIDNGFNPHYDKAVLYTDGIKWTHASRLIGDGLEHSKFGGLYDAFHSSNRFENTVYGSPYAYMQRLHSLKEEYIKRHPIKYGSITIHEDRLKEILILLKS